jgi:hypothetical protein
MWIALVIALSIAIPFVSTSVEAQQTDFLYIATYEGTGTEADPFRAHSNIRGTECTELRSDQTKGMGLALCEGPVLPTRAGIRDLTGKRTIAKADRDSLLAAGGVSLTSTTFDGLISELVDKQNISLARQNGRQRISIKGKEVWSRPAPLASYLPDAVGVLKTAFHLPVSIPSYIVSTATAWAAATLNETWTCADDSDGYYSCDNTWTRGGGSVIAIVSNTLRTINSVAVQFVFVTGAGVDSTNMYHRLTLTNIARGTATDVAGGPGIRHTGNATATYVYCVARDGATDELEYGQLVAGLRTSSGTVAATVANGDTVEVRAVEDQLSCKHNNVTVLGPITNNTGNGNVRPAIRMSGSGTATTTSVVADNSLVGVISTRQHIAPLVYQ